MSGFGIFVYWFFVVFLVIGVIATILSIDIPRPPITRGVAIATMISATIQMLLLLNAIYGFMF